MTLQIISFAIAWWLGWYLLARDWQRPVRLFAGLSLLEYAVALATDLLIGLAPSAETMDLLLRLNRPVLILPTIYWLGALIFLLPEAHPLRRLLAPVAQGLFIGLGVAFFILGAVTNWIFDYSPDAMSWTALGYLIILLFGVAALWLSYVVIRSNQIQAARLPLGLVWVATIFVTLGLTLVLLPISGRWTQLFVLAIGADLVLLGIGIAALEAFTAGETIRLDMARSFGGSMLAALIFGSQIGLAIYLLDELTFTLLLLLLAVVASAILLQTMSDTWQSLLDRLLLVRDPGVAAERQTLRETTSALSRSGPESNLAELPDQEFIKLTRRSLSSMGDLPKLASSPLIYLPEVNQRLAANGNGRGHWRARRP